MIELLSSFYGFVIAVAAVVSAITVCVGVLWSVSVACEKVMAWADRDRP